MAAVSQHSVIVFNKFTSMATTCREALTSLGANKRPPSHKGDLTKVKDENVKLRETVAHLESRLASMNISVEPSVKECTSVSYTSDASSEKESARRKKSSLVKKRMSSLSLSSDNQMNASVSRSSSILTSNLGPMDPSTALLPYASCKSTTETVLPTQAEAHKIKRLMLKCAEIEDRSEKAEEEVSILRVEKASVVQALEHVQNDNSSLRLSVSEADKELERIRSENDYLLDLIQKLHEECAEFRKRADEAERLANGLQFEMKVLEEALDDAKEVKDSAEERAFMIEQRVIELVENKEAREVQVREMFEKTEQSNSNLTLGFNNATIEVARSVDKPIVQAMENTRPPSPAYSSFSLMPQQVQRMVASSTAEEHGNGLDQLIEENNKLKMELQRSGLMCHHQQQLLMHLFKERGGGKENRVVQKNEWSQRMADVWRRCGHGFTSCLIICNLSSSLNVFSFFLY